MFQRTFQSLTELHAPVVHSHLLFRLPHGGLDLSPRDRQCALLLYVVMATPADFGLLVVWRLDAEWGLARPGITGARISCVLAFATLLNAV